MLPIFVPQGFCTYIFQQSTFKIILCGTEKIGFHSLATGNRNHIRTEKDSITSTTLLQVNSSGRYKYKM